MIHIENIHLYRNDKKILNDLSWHVQKGQHWAILGLNGSGKTTLLKVINGYIWPNEGKVQVLGETYGKTYIPKLRTRIGWVSNAMIDNFNWQDNAIEIVLSGKFGALRLFNDVTEEEIDHAVSIMEHFHCDHLANKSFEHLSQGERQRVQIARAIMADPEILILDEPCGGLDLIERENLLQTIEQIAQAENGPTLIYVTHHVEEILPCFSHVLLMKDGKNVEANAREVVLTDELLSDFFGREISLQIERERAWVAIK
ncbi:Cobalt import ATP-binding protein CbiO [Solibacillus isronensis B3W22]|uniref:Cobalt import ATP-binding protein CbiO n=1 Tax=Solibacillus isronensis B3W22 TaxID=1224748 RepID=K1KXU2_9BACL|nr:ABC transporter ATP-binding protein [Solibacillus isronensis]AMO85481.1 molybdenum ABC transporter ATP-binding protein [Solibacillus silvestris]EKB43453.1 Cobalt import ATP-binding protein CbiO [Solibacillus isronensis B3W22]